jgi:hypothetical protein
MKKTINTSGVDANKLFADDFLQMDPIKIIADKVGLVEDQLKLQTMFDAMFARWRYGYRIGCQNKRVSRTI